MDCQRKWTSQNSIGKYASILAKVFALFSVTFIEMLHKRNRLLSLNTVIYLLLIVVTVWIVYLMVYGHGGIIERKKMLNEIALLNNEIDNLKKEKAKLSWEIKNLSSNKEYLSGLAHENGYKKKDEIIFKFLKKDKVKNSIIKNR